MHEILTKILSATNLDYFINNFRWISILEIFLIALIIFAIYVKFIKNSPSRKLFNGVISIFLMYVFAKILISIKLVLIGMFLEAITIILLFSLVVIFQPELRKFLGYLGQPGFIHRTLFAPIKEERHDVNFVKELTEAIKYLSKSKIGALLVFQKIEDMAAFSEIGTKIYGLISSELLLTIFHPNTALHDGAVIITPTKILAAGVLLPLTEDPELSWQYGTRHRAAIGITEISDATCIVVSEETGFVSIVHGGKLTKIDTIEILKEELTKLIDEDENNNSKKGFFYKHLNPLKSNNDNKDN